MYVCVCWWWYLSLQKVKKDHKKYGKEFEAKDRLMQSRVSKDILVKRQEEMQAYRDYRQKCALSYQSDIPYRRELRNGLFLSPLTRYISW